MRGQRRFFSNFALKCGDYSRAAFHRIITVCVARIHFNMHLVCWQSFERMDDREYNLLVHPGGLGACAAEFP